MLKVEPQSMVWMGIDCILNYLLEQRLDILIDVRKPCLFHHPLGTYLADPSQTVPVSEWFHGCAITPRTLVAHFHLCYQCLAIIVVVAPSPARCDRLGRGTRATSNKVNVVTGWRPMKPPAMPEALSQRGSSIARRACD